MTKYVAQTDDYGCVIASLAMIADTTYEAMKTWLVAHGLTVERMAKGLHEGVWTEALGQLGYVIARRYHYDALAGALREPWPPAPFAPLHIACVVVPNGNSHAVVMMHDGLVLDPWSLMRRSLAHPDYREVNQVIGVWPRP